MPNTGLMHCIIRIYSHLSVVATVAILLLSGCSENENPRVIQHPTEQNLNPEFEYIHVISEGDSASNDPAVQLLRQRLQNYTVRYTLGEKEGESGEVLGVIADAAWDSGTEKLYLLDSQNKGVQVYDRNGGFDYRISRAGRGPGELTNPEKLSFRKNSLFILDWSFQINEYSLQEGEFEFSRQFSPGTPPFSFCMDRNRVYILSLPLSEQDGGNDFENIYQYNKDDSSEPITRFGRMYEANSFIARTTMTMGDILCTDNSDVVVQYFDWLNLLYGYNDQGELKWVTRFGDFDFIRYMETEGSSMGVETEPSYLYNFISNTRAVNENMFVVQIPERTSRSFVPLRIHTYIVNFEDGTGVYAGDHLPKILSIEEGAIIFYADDPYPKVTVASY